MTLVAEALIALVILVGAFFLLVGSIGLAKLPDLMRRLHGPSKASTLGIGALLVASMLYFALLQGDPSFHEILITLFLFITAPISAQMIAKVHLLAERREPAGDGSPRRLGYLRPRPSRRGRRLRPPSGRDPRGRSREPVLTPRGVAADGPKL